MIGIRAVPHGLSFPDHHYYSFTPQNDITALEVAQIVPLLLRWQDNNRLDMRSGPMRIGGHLFKHQMENLTPELRRHFTEQQQT